LVAKTRVYIIAGVSLNERAEFSYSYERWGPSTVYYNAGYTFTTALSCYRIQEG